MIEDLFDTATLETKVEGKSFNAVASQIDVVTQYGKRVFAHRVVRAHANTINFAGFQPLLARLVAVIAAHKASL